MWLLCCACHCACVQLWPPIQCTDGVPCSSMLLLHLLTIVSKPKTKPLRQIKHTQNICTYLYIATYLHWHISHPFSLSHNPKLKLNKRPLGDRDQEVPVPWCKCTIPLSEQHPQRMDQEHSSLSHPSPKDYQASVALSAIWTCGLVSCLQSLVDCTNEIIKSWLTTEWKALEEVSLARTVRKKKSKRRL